MCSMSDLGEAFSAANKEAKRLQEKKAEGLLEVDATESNPCNLTARKNERRTCFDEEAAECSYGGNN